MPIHRRAFLGAAGLTALPAWPSTAAVTPLSTAAPETLGFDPQRLRRIRVALQRRIDAGEAAGFQVAIARDGRLVHFESIGLRDIARRAPLTDDTLFRIRSMTKPITSVAAMMLVEENRLRLTDPIAAYIPSFARSRVYVSGDGESMLTAPAARQVQVRNLLMHTAGYSMGLGDTPVAALHRSRGVAVRASSSLATYCDAAAALPLMFEPGTQWQYGISTDILGGVIEVASGLSLPAFLQQRIFRPLGMSDTAFQIESSDVARLATLYERKDGALRVIDDTADYLAAPRAPSGGGGLISTTHDYLRFATMLMNEGELGGVRLLGPQTVRLMRANHLPPGLFATAGAGFGLGFGVDATPVGRSLYGSNGSFFWSGANRTHFWVDPTNRIVGLLMAQIAPFDLLYEDDMRALTYQAFMD
jgi:CubicO group peptidase (beta-lactamase class C family)